MQETAAYSAADSIQLELHQANAAIASAASASPPLSFCLQTENIGNDVLPLVGAQHEHRHAGMRRRKRDSQGRGSHSRSVGEFDEGRRSWIGRAALSGPDRVTLRADIPCPEGTLLRIPELLGLARRSRDH